MPSARKQRLRAGRDAAETGDSQWGGRRAGCGWSSGWVRRRAVGPLRRVAGGVAMPTGRETEREGERGAGRKGGGGGERELAAAAPAARGRAGGVARVGWASGPRRRGCSEGSYCTVCYIYMHTQYRICMVYALYALLTLLRDRSFPLLSYPSRTVRRQQRRPVAFLAFAEACTYHPNMCIQKMNILESIQDIFVYSLHIEIFESILIANSFSIFLPMFCILFA